MLELHWKKIIATTVYLQYTHTQTTHNTHTRYYRTAVVSRNERHQSLTGRIPEDQFEMERWWVMSCFRFVCFWRKKEKKKFPLFPLMMKVVGWWVDSYFRFVCFWKKKIKKEGFLFSPLMILPFVLSLFSTKWDPSNLSTRHCFALPIYISVVISSNLCCCYYLCVVVLVEGWRDRDFLLRGEKRKRKGETS